MAFASAMALDVNDVSNMLKNRIPENVIINLANSQGGGIALTQVDVDELRRLGASENLIAALSQPAAAPAASQLAIPDPPASVTVGSPSVQPAQPVTSTVVAAQPPSGAPITPVAVMTTSAYPALYDKDGWFSISNRDWIPYYLIIDTQKSRMFISRSPNGGVAIASGQNVVLNVRKDGYKLYGDTGEKLEVKIREGEATTMSLDPFGVFGNSGLTGVVADRDRVRSEVLFAPYVPTPQVIIQEPAPVIVRESPSVYFYYGRPRRWYDYWP